MFSPAADGWSPGTGPKSARFARNNDYLERYGVHEPLEPHSGMEFLKKQVKAYHSDRMSLSESLVTDQEWSAGQASVMLIKGVVDLAVVEEALKDEDVYPVMCKLQGDDKPKALATIWIIKVQDSVCGAYDDYAVSFDVHRTKEGVMAFDEDNFRIAKAYAIWYNNFGTNQCEGQFIHSVYSNSPLAIAWGREMQAVPRHPVPVLSSVDILFDETKQCDFLWGKKMLFQVYCQKKFGCRALLKEAFGLLGKCGLIRLMRRLSRATFEFDVIMPKATAEKTKRPREYTATIWKGLNPANVQFWKWNTCTDNIILGDIEKETGGAEDNNGIPLLKRGNFEPLSLCFLDKLSGVVQVKDDSELNNSSSIDSVPYRKNSEEKKSS